MKNPLHPGGFVLRECIEPLGLSVTHAEAANGPSHTRPILLQIETKAGMGAGKPVAKQIEEFTDIYSFLFWQSGVRPLAKRIDSQVLLSLNRSGQHGCASGPESFSH